MFLDLGDGNLIRWDKAFKVTIMQEDLCSVAFVGGHVEFFRDEAAKKIIKLAQSQKIKEDKSITE